MKTVSLTDKEKKMIHFLIKKGHTRIKDIADYMDLSEKTISNSLKKIDGFLQSFGVSIVRKPKVGVWIEGQFNLIQQLLRSIENIGNSVPNTKDERIVYILSSLLKASDYLTIEQFAEELYISRGTIEKDLQEIEKILEKEKVELSRIPSKGIKLEINERERRMLTSTLIKNFWGSNWHVRQENGQVLYDFKSIQPDMKEIFSETGIKEIIFVLSTFSEKEDFRFTDYAFQSLVIHLAIAAERIKRGKYVDLVNGDSLEIDPKQKEQTTILVKMLEERLSIKFPESEKHYINTHLEAARIQWNNQFPPKYTSNPLIDDKMASFIKDCLADVPYDQELVEGLTLHMQSLVKRLRLQVSIKNPYVNEIKQNYPLSFEKAIDLKRAFEQKYKIVMDDHETAYIALHFEAYLERTKLSQTQLKIIIVCSTGLGSSRLLSARIKKYFPSLKINKILSAQSLRNEHVDVDLVISTIHLELENTPTIVVSPMLTKDEMRLIEKVIQNITLEKQKATNPFLDLIDKKNILLQLQAETMDEVIGILGNHLIQNGYAKIGVIESALKREKLSYTSFDKIATPHAESQFITESAILIATLEKPIRWGHANVNIVFFIALQEDESLELDKIYEYFFNYLDNKRNMDALSKAESVEEVFMAIKKDGLK